MKKSSVLIALTGVALTGAAILLAVKINKRQEEKERKEEKQQKDEEIKSLSELKVPESTLENIVDQSRKEGFILSLHRLLRHSPTWCDDQIDAERYLEGNYNHAIHISLSLYKNAPQLDLYMVVPNYVNKSYAFPKMRDYKEKLAELTKECYIWGLPRPFIMLEAWMIVETGQKQKIMRVDPSYYSSKKDEKSDGTKSFYEDFVKTQGEKEKLEAHLSSKHGGTVKVKDLFLLWRLSFKMASENSEGGITLAQAAKVSRSLLEVEIGREENAVSYDIIVFHYTTPEPEILSRTEISTNIIAINGDVLDVEF